MVIRVATLSDHDPISQLIEGSELGQRYFQNRIEALNKMVLTGTRDGNIHVCEDKQNQCLAVLYTEKSGAFDKYPYLHMIVVAEEARNLGLGSQLMNYFEDTLYPNAGKLFLLVGKWNPRAQRLYSRLGYKVCCEFDDFYVAGETEVLMMKERTYK